MLSDPSRELAPRTRVILPVARTVAVAKASTWGRVPEPVRRVIRPLVWNIVDVISLPLDWFEELIQRTYRPRLTPLQHLRTSQTAEHQWESTGIDPQFRIEPPLPRGWVEVRLKGSGTPAALVALYLTKDGGPTASDARILGLLTPAGNALEVIVNLRGVRFARLDPSLTAGHFTIDELSLRRIGIWHLVLRAAAVYLRRVRRRNVGRLMLRTVAILRESGFHGLKRAVAAQLQSEDTPASLYYLWQEQHRLDQPAKRRLRMAVDACGYQPTMSVIVPVYNTPARLLSRCIDSVRDQLYSRWELCIADDASTSREIRPLLERYAAQDPRIKVVFRERNGHIAAASNSALALATGEFVALLDHDDELTPDALLRDVLVLNAHPDTDLIYSDEDKIDETGSRSEPFFKPEWAPETLLRNMYLGHLSVYRRSIVEAVGRFREGLEGSQDYDLALRVTEKTSRIQHIPEVLYHWRITPGSAAGEIGAKPYAYRAALDALRQALVRRAIPGAVEAHERFAGHYVVRIAPDQAQKVSIVIPTRDRADLLERCLESLFRVTTYPNFEVCVVDNGSRERATFKVLERFEQLGPERFRVIRRDVPFNFSALVNAGVAETDGELVLLLNNDTEVLDGAWLEQMAGYAQRPEIGSVGCVLLHPDRTIQHGGVVLMVGAVAGHSYAGESSEIPGYFGVLLAQSNCAAVTAACLMVRREVFTGVGGFDEGLAVAFNDVDFCLRVLRKGFRNVCLGQVRLLHHGSKSRGLEDSDEKRARFGAECALMRERWQTLLDRDLYYNPNLRTNPIDFAPLIDTAGLWR